MAMESPKTIKHVRPPQSPSDDREKYEAQSIPAQESLVTRVVGANLEKHEADVIVTSTNEGLNLSFGAVSKALSQRAGPQLQKEVRSLHSGKIDHWEILETKGHKLKCQHVFFGVLPYAAVSYKENVKKLQDFTYDCLERAATLLCKSIAFPALGTGNLGYKPEDVAAAMFVAVDVFKILYRESSLQEVHFVMHYKDSHVIKAFQKEQKLRDSIQRKYHERVRNVLSTAVDAKPDNDASLVIDDKPKFISPILTNVKTSLASGAHPVTEAVTEPVPIKVMYERGRSDADAGVAGDSDSPDGLSVEHEELFDWPCNKCGKEGTVKEAISYCKTCDSFFCAKCLQDHNQFSRNHVILGHLEKDIWGKFRPAVNFKHKYE